MTDDLRIAETLFGDVHLPGHHKQADKRDPNTEQQDADEANSQCEGEMPAMEALVAHVWHPVPMHWHIMATMSKPCKLTLHRDRALPLKRVGMLLGLCKAARKPSQEACNASRRNLFL